VKTFFTSDTHYGHGNIIDYCNRPFTDRGDMNDTMVTAHNAVVGPHDLVVHLGDFCFGSNEYVANMVSRLNGHFILIRGNHDRKLTPLKEAGWNIHAEWSMTVDGASLYLRHKPEFDCAKWPTGTDWHLCGHVHTAWRKRESNRRRDPARENIINVGVDQWGFVPRTWDELVG
jgi:calcineurin-like phosphoesterase family protein